MTSIGARKDLTDELQYDLNETKPQPLSRERDASYFAKLADYPTPKLVHPVRKVVFTIKSKDQGFVDGGQNAGTYNASWTWFEAGLERFDREQVCKFRTA